VVCVCVCVCAEPEMAKGLEKELSDLPEPSEKNLKKAAEMLEEMLSKGGPEMEKELENLRTSAAELREEMRREDAGGPQLPQGKAGSGPQLPPKSGPQIPPEFAFGPQLPPELGGPDPKGQFTGNPDWAKLMQEEALIDPEVAEMIEGCDGDAKKIYAKVKARFETRSEEIMRESQGTRPQPITQHPRLPWPFLQAATHGAEERRTGCAGRSEGMKVEFREFDPVNLWVSALMHCVRRIDASEPGSLIRHDCCVRRVAACVRRMHTAHSMLPAAHPAVCCRWARRPHLEISAKPPPRNQPLGGSKIGSRRVCRVGEPLLSRSVEWRRSAALHGVHKPEH
jgi:hypothetical protein